MAYTLSSCLRPFRFQVLLDWEVVYGYSTTQGANEKELQEEKEGLPLILELLPSSHAVAGRLVDSMS